MRDLVYPLFIRRSAWSCLLMQRSRSYVLLWFTKFKLLSLKDSDLCTVLYQIPYPPTWMIFIFTAISTLYKIHPSRCCHRVRPNSTDSVTWDTLASCQSSSFLDISRACKRLHRGHFVLLDAFLHSRWKHAPHNSHLITLSNSHGNITSLEQHSSHTNPLAWQSSQPVTCVLHIWTSSCSLIGRTPYLTCIRSWIEYMCGSLII